MNQRFNKGDLLGKLKVMSKPKAHGLSQKALEQTLIDFFAGCPDRVRARWLVVECLEPMSDEELVDRALNTPSRPISEVPMSVIPPIILCVFQLVDRPLWVGTGLSRPPPNFHPGNLLCWLDRPDSAITGPSR
jgi:hypothetical protein